MTILSFIGALFIVALAIIVIVLWTHWVRERFSRENVYDQFDFQDLDGRGPRRLYIAYYLVVSALSGLVMLGVIYLMFLILADMVRGVL
jgi:hypothetical protein